MSKVETARQRGKIRRGYLCVLVSLYIWLVTYAVAFTNFAPWNFKSDAWMIVGLVSLALGVTSIPATAVSLFLGVKGFREAPIVSAVGLLVTGLWIAVVLPFFFTLVFAR